MHLAAASRVAALALLPAAALAQGVSLPASLGPDTRELNSLMPSPLMHASARVQQLFELGELGQSQMTVHSVSLRFDGPSSGSGARHTIQKVTLRLGASARSIATLGAVFDANLTQPLVTGLAAQAVSFTADGSANVGPEPWGGANQELRFALAQPVPITVPQGGCLALELLIDGNDNATANDAAWLDFHVDAAGAGIPGFVVHDGNGCPAGANATAGMTLETAGQYVPGAAFTIYGDHYLGNAPVTTLLTAQLLSQKVGLPLTTPTCWLYVDLASGLPILQQTTDATGALATFSGGENSIPVPKNPTFCGAKLYVQNAAPTQPWTGNALGVGSSNYRTIVLGCSGTPQVKAWFATNHVTSGASVATFTGYGALAVRLN